MKKYYYAKKNEKFGPFTLDQLKDQSLTKDCLVWYEGLETWVPVEQIEELKELYSQPPPIPPVLKSEVKEYSYIIIKNKATGRKERVFPHRWKEIAELYGEDKYIILSYIDEYGNTIDAEGGLVEKSQVPKSYLVESILVTLFCCLPAGIAGIVYAARVESAYNLGKYQEAEEASQSAAMWTKISFWIGLAGTILYIMLMTIEEFI